MYKYTLKESVKTALILLFIYLLFIMYVLFARARIQKLDANSYTENGHNKSIKIQIKK